MARRPLLERIWSVLCLEWGREWQRRHAILLSGPFLLALTAMTVYLWIRGTYESVYMPLSMLMGWLLLAVVAAMWQFGKRLGGPAAVYCVVGILTGWIMQGYLWTVFLLDGWEKHGAGLLKALLFYTVLWAGTSVALGFQVLEPAPNDSHDQSKPD